VGNYSRGITRSRPSRWSPETQARHRWFNNGGPSMLPTGRGALSPTRTAWTHETLRSQHRRGRCTHEHPPMTEPSSRATGPARTHRLRTAPSPTGAGDGASSGAAQPTTDTEATTTVPLVRAGAQCTMGNLRAKGCGPLEDEPVNCGWISAASVHRPASSTGPRTSLPCAPRCGCSGPRPPPAQRTRPPRRARRARRARRPGRPPPQQPLPHQPRPGPGRRERSTPSTPSPSTPPIPAPRRRGARG